MKYNEKKNQTRIIMRYVIVIGYNVFLYPYFSDEI